MKNKVSKKPPYFALIFSGLIILGIVGWGMNLVKVFTGCDWDTNSNLKCEAVRLVGIPVAPLGAVVGYMNFDKE